MKRPADPHLRCKTAVTILVILTVFFGCDPAAAQDPNALEDRLFSDESSAPWEIVADEVSYDDRTETYVASGRVEISQEDRRLTADFVRFDHKTFDASARGHVVLSVGKDLLIGEEMDINLQSQTGTVRDGTIFLSENHFYIQGERIEKVGEAAYEVEGATVTSCDGEVPAWKITGRKVNVTVEGYGVVRHAAFWTRRVPIAYSPVVFFPAKRERQTGLLFPEFGESDRKGSFYLQPFFWAINEESDATFYGHYMDRRGFRLGGEYRYLLDESSRGTAMFDYLDDRQVDDGIGDNTDRWGYSEDNFLRTNRDRYWFRMKHDQGLPGGYFARLDLDVVSDQDYLTDFRWGLTGFEETRTAFDGMFNRELEAYTDTVRTNSMVVSRYGQQFSFNAGTVWNDNVVARQDQPLVDRPDVSIEDTSLHKLPFATFDAIKQPVGSTPFFWDMSSAYDFLYSEDNSRGHRIDLNPRAYWPFELFRYLSVEPSAGVRQTAWWITEFQDQDLPEVSDEAGKEKEAYRFLYDLKLDTSTEFYRIFNIGGESLEAVRHTIRPRVVYEFIPDEDQDDLPAFFSIDEDDDTTELDDGINRIDRRHLITYSLTQHFTGKSRVKAGSESDGTAANENATPDYRYRTFGYLELSQGYDIFEAREDNPDQRIDPDRKRPFTNLLAELEFYPTTRFSLRGDTEWDPYDNRLVTRNARFSWESLRGDRVQGEYRYDGTDSDDVIESAYGALTLKLPKNFTAYTSHEHDLDANERIETIFGLIYTSQCWAVDVRYTDEDDNQEVAFMVRLNGLGEIGNF